MTDHMRHIRGLATASLILVAGAAQAAPPAAPGRPNPQPALSNALRPSQPKVNPQYNGARPIGGDWWRTYPWSPYNAWRNPYWYPPYNTNYPYPPDQAYPLYPYPVRPPYPTPLPYPVPLPWGTIGSGNR
jgi:hypothetical protein